MLRTVTLFIYVSSNWTRITKAFAHNWKYRYKQYCTKIEKKNVLYNSLQFVIRLLFFKFCLYLWTINSENLWDTDTFWKIPNKLMVFLAKLYWNFFSFFKLCIILKIYYWDRLTMVEIFEKMYEESKDQIQREYIVYLKLLLRLQTCYII